MHACVFKGFEDHFEFLYDSEARLLFENWTVHTSYGNEIDNTDSMGTFINEILSSAEIQNIQNKSYMHDKPPRHQYTDLNRTYQPESKNFAMYRMENHKVKKERKIDNKRLERLGSFMMPNDLMQRQIWQSALDMISHSICNQNNSDISSESEDHDID
jgi:hypothetical protein